MCQNQVSFRNKMVWLSVTAKNKNAAGQAGKLFEKRKTCKYYLAIVRGHVDFELADVEYDVGKLKLHAHTQSLKSFCIKLVWFDTTDKSVLIPF